MKDDLPHVNLTADFKTRLNKKKTTCRLCREKSDKVTECIKHKFKHRLQTTTNNKQTGAKTQTVKRTKDLASSPKFCIPLLNRW